MTTAYGASITRGATTACSITALSYDIEHRETRITDSLGHTTVFQANERGMPVAKVDALGGAWSYRYDAQWRTSAATDPAGRITTWEYDAYGNLLAQTLPDGSVVRAEYNAARSRHA
ncbi:hypothetical protein AAFM48_23985 [Burkholderia pseudomallei]